MVLVRSCTARDFVRCWGVVECCLALEAAVFVVVVALRYVTLILEKNKIEVIKV